MPGRLSRKLPLRAKIYIKRDLILCDARLLSIVHAHGVNNRYLLRYGRERGNRTFLSSRRRIDFKCRYAPRCGIAVTRGFIYIMERYRKGSSSDNNQRAISIRGGGLASEASKRRTKVTRVNDRSVDFISRSRGDTI